MATREEKKAERQDLTTGSLLGKLILFCLPVMLTGVLQLVYNTADLLVVSYFGSGSLAMTAVGDNGSLINIAVNTFVALSSGANVVIASQKGAKRVEDANQTIGSSLILAVLVGLGVGLAGFFLAPTFLRWMNTPEEILPLASLYLKVYFLGLPFLMVYNFGNALLRGLGDSTTPLIILALCGVLNVGGNIGLVMAFYRGLGMANGDVLGVALSTVLCEAAEAVLAVVFLFRHKKKGPYGASWAKMRLEKRAVKEVLRNGIPFALESFAFSTSNVVIQARANSMGAEVMAGGTASDNIEAYIYTALYSFSAGETAFAAQNKGANQPDRVKKSFLCSLLLILTIGAILGGIAAGCRYPLIGIFLHGEEEAGAIEIGASRLLLMGTTYLLCSIMDDCSGCLRGLGHTLAPTLITVFWAVLFRICYAELFFRFVIQPSADFTLAQKEVLLYFAYASCWAGSVLTYSVVTPILMKKDLCAMREAQAKQAQIQ